MKRYYPVIFLVSCSALMFEVSLTRIFSISLWYHFAFMVISIAMLGIASPGTVLAVFPTRFRSESFFGVLACTAGAAILISFIASNHIPFDPARFSWDRAQVFYLLIYCIVLSVPFFFTGCLIALAFSMYSDKAGAIYGFDMIGAGTGSLAVLAILNTASPEYAVALASLICLTGAFIAGKKNIRTISLVFVVMNLFTIFIYPDLLKKEMSPYKPLSHYMKFPGAEHLQTFFSSYARIDLFRSPGVRYAPGLSLRFTGALPQQEGIAVDGQRIEVITDARDRSQLSFIGHLPSSAAYAAGKKDDVLIIDPGGGLHVLTAEYYGAARIRKAESNPMVIDVIKGHYGAFSGRIFEKDTWSGYGRNFLRPGTHGAYDLIDISLTGTAVTGFSGIAEDYRFTVEAFTKYLSNLKPDGMLSISLYLLPPPRTEFRILTTLTAAFEKTGVRDIRSRLFALRSWDSITMLVKSSPFERTETDRLKEFSRERQFDPVFYPGIRADEYRSNVRTGSDEYFMGFQSLLGPETRTAFITDYLFDIRPVYDRNPFFNYHLRLENIRTIYRLMGEKWFYFLEEGYLLPVLFGVAFLLSVFIILVPPVIGKAFKNYLFKIGPARDRSTATFPVILYFSMLGLGFMFIEITLIQSSVLVLENPAYSVAAVVTAVLAGSGIGSILSGRTSRIGLPLSLPVLASVILIYSLLYPMLAELIYPLHPYFRIAAVFISILPMGFLMGMPFPSGMKVLGEKYPALIPWAWAINACLSVLAPMLTIMIALAAGFQTVLWLAAGMYMIAYVCMRKMLTCVNLD